MERGTFDIARTDGSDFSLIRSNLRAKCPLGSQALLATLLLLVAASPLAAQGTLGNPDNENLGGQGPGDMVVVQRGSTTYVEMLNFDAHQIVTYRLEADNALTEVGQTPTCDEPRQLVVTPDNRWLFAVCSSENSLRTYRVLDIPSVSGPLQESVRIDVGETPYDAELVCPASGGESFLIAVAKLGSNEVALFQIGGGDFEPGTDFYVVPLNSQATGISTHVVKAICRQLDLEVPSASVRSNGRKPSASAGRAALDAAVIVAANSTSNDLTVLGVGDDGTLRGIMASVPTGGSPRALAFDPSGRRLYVAVRGTPPAEDQIRTYKVGVGGELTFVGATPGGRFLTDIEATSDRVFVVTINNQNRDEIRTYRRRGNDLILDSAITTPSQPNFKQITVGPSQGNLTNVFVTEYQGGFMRSLTYTRDNQVACVGDAETLCLNGMELLVDFVASGNYGYGQAASLTSDTGYFWFFNRDNIEIVPKVLDARTVNGSFWVFYGALSDVAYNLRVTDTRTGRVKEYGNPAGTLASQADTSAFPAASGGPRKSAIGAAATAEELYALYSAGKSAQAPLQWATCAPDSARLCLTQNRFQIHVDWRVPSDGRSGSGTAVPVTGDTGYFWFFDSANVELIIKVLDARVINGKFWVFYGALSNVEYIITVTDTQTGAQKTYVNPSGTLASTADTSAF